MKPTPRKAWPAPLLLTFITGAVGLIPTLFPAPPSAPQAGRAHLSAELPPGAQGWQLSLDAPRFWTGSIPALTSILTKLSGTPISALDAQALSKTPVLLEYRNSTPLKVSLSPTPTSKLVPSTSPFFGSPGAVFEWVHGAFRVRGNLYQAPHAPSIYSGRIQAMLPFSGFGGAASPGFPGSFLNSIPANAQRTLVVDPILLRLPSTYHSPLFSTWKRWNFEPFPGLASSIGPAIAYTQWQEHALWIVGIKNSQVAERALAERFPSSVIPQTSDWVVGAKAHALTPTGPAWLLRGDKLWAVKNGGIYPIKAAVSSTLAKRSSHPPQRRTFEDEIGRLAATEQGWHLVLTLTSTHLGIRWGVLLRWPTPSSQQAQGYLVVEPLADSTPR